MAEKSLTIDEIKQKKVDLELAVLNLLKAFEKETGVRLDMIGTKRKSPKMEKQKGVPYPVEVERWGDTDLQDVNIEIRYFD